MLELLQSNKMHALVNTFFQRNLQRPKNPFEPTRVVVQSVGMGQWLKVQLAQRAGISANLNCLLPAELIWQLYQALLPQHRLPDESPFSQPLLTWHLMQLLPDCREQEFEHIQRYLDGSGDSQLRLFQLSKTIAGLFDQYLIYRPDWIASWEVPDNNSAVITPDQAWQVMLWRKLLEVPGIDGLQHRTSLHTAFIDTLSQAGTSQPGTSQKRTIPDALSDTISVFGLSSLPPMHLRTLQAVAELTNVDIYFLNPCQHYWGDIVSEKEVTKRSIRRLTGTAGPLEEEDYLETGNPLLSSMGKQGREFLELLLGTDNIAMQEHFEPWDDETVLGSVKNDILNLEFGGLYDEGRQLPGKQQKPVDDNSIQLHCCHSPMREVEILYDQILAMIDRNPAGEIGPADIIVMAPDISRYAPFIQAVFQDKIHFSITDRAANQEHAILVAFEKLIALPDSRLSATTVMDFLEVPSIADKFSLDENDLSTLLYWIRQTGIRWEVDAASRHENWGLPASEHNTWSFGLKRLLLGFAMQGSETAVYDDIAPFEVGAGDSSLIGTFCRIVDLLDEHRKRLGQTQTAPEWLITLTDLMDDFFLGEGKEELALNTVREALVSFIEQVQRTHFTDPVSPSLLRYWMADHLGNQRQGRGFMSGGITFATLVPMRSIPYKMVCLIGMNDKQYPRENKPPGFDLMARDYRKADRSRRNDDRYLFLEALLSAERCFYISYEGRSLKDNKVKPASVLVNELDEYLARIYDMSFVVDHPLQPFDDKYFNGQNPALVSYQENWYQALADKKPPEKFLDAPLPDNPDDRLKELRQLTDFFRHPARFYLRSLGIFFEIDEDELQETESFQLDGLARYHIADSALQAMISEIPMDAWLARQRALGIVMEGEPGERQLKQELQKAANVYQALQDLLSNKTSTKPSLLTGSLDLDSGPLTGEVPGFDHQYIDFRTGTLRKRQVLTAWVKHLFVNGLGYEVETPLLSTNKDTTVSYSFNRLTRDMAIQYLDQLARLYHKGLSTPLPFLPETSWRLFNGLNDNNQPAVAIDAAYEVYQPSSGQGWAEGDDKNNQRLFNFPGDFTQQFIDTAEAIYRPIVDNSRGIK